MEGYTRKVSVVVNSLVVGLFVMHIFLVFAQFASFALSPGKEQCCLMKVTERKGQRLDSRSRGFAQVTLDAGFMLHIKGQHCHSRGADKCGMVVTALLGHRRNRTRPLHKDLSYHVIILLAPHSNPSGQVLSPPILQMRNLETGI